MACFIRYVNLNDDSQEHLYQGIIISKIFSYTCDKVRSTEKDDIDSKYISRFESTITYYNKNSTKNTYIKKDFASTT